MAVAKMRAKLFEKIDPMIRETQIFSRKLVREMALGLLSSSKHKQGPVPTSKWQILTHPASVDEVQARVRTQTRRTGSKKKEAISGNELEAATAGNTWTEIFWTTSNGSRADGGRRCQMRG